MKKENLLYKQSRLFRQLETDGNVLTAIFNSNPSVQYVYKNLPKEQIDELRSAESQGGFFLRQIRNNEKIEFVRLPVE